MLRPNPFTVRGHLRRCWLFVYRSPEEAVRSLLPRPLQPVTAGGFGFWNVVVCELTQMRPTPLPAAMGLAYQHVAYRVYVRAHTADGSVVEGLHFCRSDCDRHIVTVLGNCLSDFHFHAGRIAITENGETVHGRIDVPGGNAEFRMHDRTPASLTRGSPFPNLDQAATFLKYKPFGLSVTPDGGLNVVRVIRDEEAWRSRLMTVEKARWEFFDGLPMDFEICFSVEPIDYQWCRGESRRLAP
jgi:uncharacterized protein YqjF (DUF2071 family)